MTPEENEAWQNAISPLDYLDLHALSKAELLQSVWRLDDRGVPGWAAKLRFLLLTWYSEPIESWHPKFALRSEIALAGIQIIHPWEEYWDLEPLYNRVFVRFAQEALRPFVEHKTQGDSSCQGSYKPLADLYTRCDTFVRPLNNWEWHNPYLDHKADLDEYKQSDEHLHSRDLAYHLSSMVHNIIGLEKRNVWNFRYTDSLQDIIEHLNRQHQWRLDGQVGATMKDGPNYSELIADAYLTALEAECPPPDWLPILFP